MAISNHDVVLDLDDILKKTILLVRQVADKFYFKGQNSGSEESHLKVSLKNNTFADFVTDIDISIEKELATELNNAFPHFRYFSTFYIRFLGEEGTSLPETKPISFDPKQYYWILDPIDGTTNYIHTLMAQSCISLALVQVFEDARKWPESILGIIFIPFTNNVSIWFCFYL